jgi:hypothetical protein
MASITSGVRTDVIPLSFTLLASDSSLNNIASFPNGKNIYVSLGPCPSYDPVEIIICIHIYVPYICP